MLREYLNISWDTLRQHRFRTFLTLLAIVLGSFSIVLMTSLAESGLATIMSGVESLGGSRIIFIGPKQPERAKDKAFYSRGLIPEDITLIKEQVPYVERVSSIKTLNSREFRVRQKDETIIADVVASDDNFIKTFDMSLQQGRNFQQSDLDDMRRVIILGAELRTKLFDQEQALDREITLFNATYRVIGILAKNHKMGVQIGFDWDLFAVLPETTFTEREGYRSPVEIMVVTTDKNKNEIVKRIINTLLERRHYNIDDFQILDFNALMKQFENMFALIKIIVAIIAGIALFIGGVGIMNIMLVSVNERTREIGIRRAVGATALSIIHQFLVESSLLTMVGGVTGVGLAIGVKMIADRIIIQFEPSWTGVLSLESILYALFAALLVGNLFGYFPAKRASKFEIDRCLRVERG
ncbi:ABC transporter permease [candidate division CSSED10-310 bacterium]|uniref:ABC transporter permease n=1 Tax=candidate division CSSED10-310 bacterium TaxID=2855610 RepID=A0ABV6YS66_UNCC1